MTDEVLFTSGDPEEVIQLERALASGAFATVYKVPYENDKFLL